MHAFQVGYLPERNDEENVVLFSAAVVLMKTTLVNNAATEVPGSVQYDAYLFLCVFPFVRLCWIMPYFAFQLIQRSTHLRIDIHKAKQPLLYETYISCP